MRPLYLEETGIGKRDERNHIEERVSPPPPTPEPKGGGGNTRLWVRGWANPIWTTGEKAWHFFYFVGVVFLSSQEASLSYYLLVRLPAIRKETCRTLR